MFVKVLTLTAATIAAVHLGRQRRRRRKHRHSVSVSATCPLHREPASIVATKPSSSESQDDWFRVVVILFLSISALLGIAMFMGQLYISDDLFQLSLIGISTLLTVLTILRLGSISTKEIELETTKRSTKSSTHLVDLSGDWIKNQNESTSTEAVFELMKIGPLLRTAVRLVHGIQIQQTKDQFHFTVVSIIKFLKITEVYSMSGDPSQWKRRDLRRGRHLGFIECSSETNSLKVHLEWDAPFPGKGTDEFVLLSKEKLLVRSTLYSDEGIASYDTIYDKSTK